MCLLAVPEELSPAEFVSLTAACLVPKVAAKCKQVLQLGPREPLPIFELPMAPTR